MDETTYKATQDQVLMLVTLSAMLPLEEFLQAIARAETLGPILDPTLYRDFLYSDGRESLDFIKEAAARFLEVKRLALEWKQKHPGLPVPA